ncbi:MAG: oligosaccharide flippase family protein, partial [Microgenomates group bacterium]
MQNNNEKLKIGFIFILFKTPQSEVERLKKEVKSFRFKKYKIYFIDNTKNNRGFAGGVNEGIKLGLKDGIDIFAIANPDISLTFPNKLNNLTDYTELLEASKYFDIWGYGMRQQQKIYYGGKIDSWRMSGGLIDKKPSSRFIEVDFVSGSLMFIKKKVIKKIGLFDESYFMYYEDVDYCWRAKREGFKIGIDSKIVYDHFEVSQSNPIKSYYLFKNRLKFLLKYGSFSQKLFELLRLPKTFYEEVKKRPFYLNFFSLNVSSVINKILHFFMFLVLIRVFPPETYAIYTLAWTQIGLFQPFVDAGTTTYGLVNLGKKDDEKNLSLFNLRLFLGLIATLITIATMFLFSYQKTLYLPIILTSSVIISNSISGSFLIFTSIKDKAYLSSFLSLFFQLLLVVLTVILVFLTRNIYSVFVAIFLIYSIYSTVCFLLIKKEIGRIKWQINFNSWLPILKKSLVFLTISLLASFYSKIDIILLNKIKGGTAVGIYSSAYKFLDALLFIASSYNISSLPIFSRSARENINFFKNKIKKDVFLLSVIGFSIALGIYIFSPVVLPWVFKSAYLKAIAPLRVIIF